MQEALAPLRMQIMTTMLCLFNLYEGISDARRLTAAFNHNVNGWADEQGAKARVYIKCFANDLCDAF